MLSYAAVLLVIGVNLAVFLSLSICAVDCSALIILVGMRSASGL